MKKNNLKTMPKLKSENEERDFWATHDATDYFDMAKVVRNPVFPNLRPSTKSISLRLPEYLLDRIKQLANARDVPYQSLMKVFLAERVKKELRC